MTDDLRPSGSGGKLGWYWVKHSQGWVGVDVGRGLMLIGIDEFGKITRTRRRAEWDDAAMTEEEALLEHLSGASAEADRDLKRRRQQKKENGDEPPKPPPMDPATSRFLESD